MNNNDIARSVFTALNNPSGRKIIKSYQDALLRRQLVYASRNSPFYRQKFSEAGVTPEKVHCAEDLPILPFFTSPRDLQEDPFQFLAVPREKIRYVMSSSGTTGAPKMVFLTRKDWDYLISVIYNALVLMKITSKDVAQILFCYGTPAWMTGSVLQSSFDLLNAFVLPTGNTDAPLKQIETMRRFGVTILAGTPSYIHRLTEEGMKKYDLRKIGVRVIRLGAEPWSPGLRQYLQDAWGARVYDAYGMMEMGSAIAGECPIQDGLHVNPYYAVEIIDPMSGENLPAGKTGELVLTTLNREGCPLIRYRTGDLAYRMDDGPCPCNELPTMRISRITGRVDDMLFLGSGENLFPEQVEKALLFLPGLIDFQMVIQADRSQDRITLRLETEVPGDALKETVRQRLYENLSFLHHDIFHSETIAPLEFEFIPTGTLQREYPIKQRRVIDRRHR